MKKILVNLKDWLDLNENIDYAMQIEGLDITVFPSLPYLYIYKNCGVKIGSQKISSFDDGPHTGSISANHLKDFGVEAVILNHRECQIDEVEKICAKVTNAQKHNIEVILCVGTIEESELTKIKTVLDKTSTAGISIAYEPIEEMQLDEIKLNFDYIREKLKDYDISYIYGNNITVANIVEFDQELDADGYLISTHALNVDNLKNIISKLHD